MNKPSFVIDAIENYDNKKLSIALTFNKDKMISLEILENWVSDFYVIEIESEKVLSSKTLYLKDEDEVIKGIEDFLVTVK